MDREEKKFLELLSLNFPTSAKAATEIVNLSAILNLPKGTEFFATDIHGEYDAFSHILRNGSGSIRMKIDELFSDEMDEDERRFFASLIYYPSQKIAQGLDEADDTHAWYAQTILRLVRICRYVARKYTRSKVRKALPADFAYIIEELMAEDAGEPDKAAYYRAIIDSVIDCGRASALIDALCRLVQRLAIDHLHIIGDIFDRGPAPDKIMDALIEYHSLDLQWGNHDILWMGASLGQRGCICHVVRNCARYGNLSILEDAYGINLLPLASFANRAYADDPCVAFELKGSPELTQVEHDMCVRIQKAMAIMQFKVEGALIEKYPEFNLQSRRLLDKIDYDVATVEIDGEIFPLADPVFPTVDPADPYRLTDEEEGVLRRLESAFRNCEKLTRHMRFLVRTGTMYKVYNNNLLLHACVPLNDDGSLRESNIYGKHVAGRALYDEIEKWVHAAFEAPDEATRERGRDLLWYMWLGDGSPLFAKSKMATFETYFVADKTARVEAKNAFYSLIDDKRAIAGILADFGLDFENSHIICGHVPVKVKDGEDPVRCGGHVLCIDGGFSKAYQATTGIAGFTLISNSYGFVLCAHMPPDSKADAIAQEMDIHSSRRIVETVSQRTLVADTDTGRLLQSQIAELKNLMDAYATGEIAEKV